MKDVNETANQLFSIEESMIDNKEDGIDMSQTSECNNVDDEPSRTIERSGDQKTLKAKLYRK